MGGEIARKRFYSILDNFEYSALTMPALNDSGLSFKLRLLPESYNVEHLIINRSRTIDWRSESGVEHLFSSDDFSACKSWKNIGSKWNNFIWVDAAFNRDVLKNNDIINKIILLRGSVIASNTPTQDTFAKKHPHIEVICQHIMKTEGFDELLVAYSNDESRTEVLAHYRNFIEKYFDEESTNELRAKLESKFKETLEGLGSLVQ